MENILFVCSANRDRSKTAAEYFSEKYNDDYNFLSAGTNQKICKNLGTTFISWEVLNWADTIYVMQKKHKRKINQYFGNSFNKQMLILEIKDTYRYFEPELVAVLEEKVNFDK